MPQYEIIIYGMREFALYVTAAKYVITENKRTTLIEFVDKQGGVVAELYVSTTQAFLVRPPIMLAD